MPPTDTETATPLHLDSAVSQRRWWTLSVLCLSLLIVSVGNSSLNVAIPTLAREFSATTSQLQWVVAVYSLVFAGLLFAAGALGDRFGRKGALQAGLAGFLVAVIAASAATEMWQLIAARAVMGATAAFIMPSTLSILVNVFPPAERSRAIAIWAGVTGGAGAIGPVASGWVLGHFHVGAVFLINVPVILLALAAGAVLVPRSSDPGHTALDPVGAVLSTVGLASLVYALIQGPDVGWLDAETLIAATLAVTSIVGFVWWERRVAHPMLDMSLFRNPAFSTGTAGMILLFLALYGVMFLVSQYFQLVLGYSPLGSALRFLPITPIMILVAPNTPRLVARFGANRTVSLGLALVAFGLLGFRGLGLDTSYGYALLCVSVLVAGIAIAMSPMTAALMSAVPAERAGVGSAMNDTTRELGAALGIAVLGSIAASHYGRAIDALTLPGEARTIAHDSLAGALALSQRIGGEMGGALATRAQIAFVEGLHTAVTVGSLLALTAAVLVLRFLPRQTPQGGGRHHDSGTIDLVATDGPQATAGLDEVR